MSSTSQQCDLTLAQRTVYVMARNLAWRANEGGTRDSVRGGLAVLGDAGQVKYNVTQKNRTDRYD